MTSHNASEKLGFLVTSVLVYVYKHKTVAYKETNTKPWSDPMRPDDVGMGLALGALDL